MSHADEKESGLIADPKAIEFTQKSLVFDALSLYYVLDDPYAERCLGGGVNTTNVTFAVEDTWDETLKSIETGLEKIEKSPYLCQAVCAADISRAKEEGKLAVIVGTQGASMVERHLWRITLMWRLGLRYIGLAYTAGNLFGDGCGESRNGGLTFLGKEFIAAVNELPLILDVSHCGHQTRAEAVKLARIPVCTHSNSYTINPNDRNTKDETVKVIASKGGVVGICGLPRSVKSENPTIQDMLDHCDYYKKLVDSQHIGVGLDFIEAYQESKQVLPESVRWRTWRPDIFGTVEEFKSQKYPKGLDSIQLLPNLTQGLFDRAYTEEEVADILGGNWFQHFKKFIG